MIKQEKIRNADNQSDWSTSEDGKINQAAKSNTNTANKTMTFLKQLTPARACHATIPILSTPTMHIQKH
uniref:Uncharacterized protein n=1 Tax=Arundo donax TaxID=35708 RepID=A0A0A8YIA0_ARUDO